MDNEKKLRKGLRPVILAYMAKNPNKLKEGLFDSVMDHVNAIMQKTNSKRFDKKLDQVASSSPEGKKKVAKVKQMMSNIERDMKGGADFEKMMGF